jgi:hypothetical protein
MSNASGRFMPDEASFRSARRGLRSPTAAAVAGIVFALLDVASTVLIRLAVPQDPAAATDWILENRSTLVFGLNLIPFAGIAFLWFMGVIRERLGILEDQFLSTVVLGSGLLFMGMSFIGGALIGGLLVAFPAYAEGSIESGLLAFGRTTAYVVINLYAVRMSAVFMTASATLWWRTRVMPRWLAAITFPTALVLLLNTTLDLWLSLVFAAWVFLVSVLVLILNMRERARESSETVD